MKYDITILIPGIRTELWEGVYKSIERSFKGTFELVLVGPYELPASLQNKKNITFIKSFMSPIACRQQGLLAAQGDWICYAADDVLFLEGSLDRALSIVAQNNFDYKTVVVGKYLEDVDHIKTDNLLMRQDPYWSLSFHTGLKSILRPFMNNFYLINTGLVSRQLMFEIGGWDCQFEACAMACVDLSLRLQIYGCNPILQHEPIFQSTHLPGLMGDHAPIHNGQTQHDEPLFFQIWSNSRAINRAVISLNTWKLCPERWERRFGAAPV